MAKTRGDGASGKPIKVTRNRALGPNRAAQHAQRDARRAEVRHNSAIERSMRASKGKTTRRRP